MANETKGRQTSPVLLAMFSLLGVVLGATLQYFMSVKAQKEKLWDDLRTTTYTQYIENTAKLPVLTNPETSAEARSLRDSARFLIALYGSREVVQQMSAYVKWEGNRPPKDSPEYKEFQQSSLILFAKMRNDLMPESEKVDPEVIRPILFPPQHLESKSASPPR